jgi:drug/metabolite transporter (DMT)-like permease
MMFWLGGYASIPASQASILNETANAWIVLFAWLVLDETISKRRVLGLLLTIAGVLVILLV